MAVCDVCGAAGQGTIVGAEDMRKAVFGNGFDPFALGLVKDPMSTLVGTSEAYEVWKRTIVAQDTSDWNICGGCMTKLRSYLGGAPKPAGVRQASVSAHPAVGAKAAAQAERKYGPTAGTGGKPEPATLVEGEKAKKWWQFWK